MNYFTYNDYIDYSCNEKLIEALKVEEKNIKYEVIEENNHKEKVIKKLRNKKQLCKLLNYFFNFNTKIKEDSIEEIKNIKLNTSNDSILIKIKDKGIYIFIEHLIKIDYNMAYKCLNYSIEIIKQWKVLNENPKNKRYPIVIPIIIYTGDKKWNAKKDFKDLRLTYSSFENSRINLAYNIIDLKGYIEILSKN